MGNENELTTCYHKGCGKKFDPNNNPNDACRYHSGEPFFHDAYKGWSCCNKKCTDFTEFLNIPGCTVSQHSNEKPPEPKPIVKESNPEEVIEVKPRVASTLKRPSYDSPMIVLKPELTPSLKQQKPIEFNDNSSNKTKTDDTINIGTSCQNGGCNKSYEGQNSNTETCIYHPGTPIFHEGMKFWSCCKRKTSDFNAFLNQEGCARGSHVWHKKDSNKEVVECRWDWHQTGNFVVLAVYAKHYCPYKSTIQINPIRVILNLVFPQEANSFQLDLELTGIVDVEQSQCYMYGTKVEIKLRKKEIGSWSKLDIPHKQKEEICKETEVNKVEELAPQVDAVDLDDLQII